MNKTNKERLLKLADFLETRAKPSRFDISVIAIANEDVSEAELIRPKEGFCGTAACAIGHCPVAFPHVFKYSRYAGSILVVNKNTIQEDFEAVEDYFGIDDYESDLLFGPYAYDEEIRKAGVRTVTPKRVAKRIRKFVAGELLDANQS